MTNAELIITAREIVNNHLRFYDVMSSVRSLLAAIAAALEAAEAERDILARGFVAAVADLRLEPDFDADMKACPNDPNFIDIRAALALVEKEQQ